MTNTNNKQFNSLDIKFVQDLPAETAANYSGGACMSANTTSTSEAGSQGISFNSNKGTDEDLMRYLYSSGGTPFVDLDTMLELTQF